MRAGHLRTLVTVQYRTETDPDDADTFGEVDPVWATYAVRAMDIRQDTGREGFRDGTPIARQPVTFVCRWDRDMADINETYRLSVGGVIYDIESVINLHNRNRELHIVGVRRDG